MDPPDDVRSCRVCHESKPLGMFPKNRPDGTRFFCCLECQAESYSERYQRDDRRRAFQVAYSMNGGVVRRFPHLERLDPDLLVTVMLETQSCRYCHLPNHSAGRGFQLDHVIPLSKGGAHSLDNIALCCDRRNRAKWDSTESVYLDWLHGARHRPETSGQ